MFLKQLRKSNNFDLSFTKNPRICKPLLNLKNFCLLGLLWIHFAVVSFPIPVSNRHFLDEALLLLPHVPRRIQKSKINYYKNEEPYARLIQIDFRNV